MAAATAAATVALVAATVASAVTVALATTNLAVTVALATTGLAAVATAVGATSAAGVSGGEPNHRVVADQPRPAEL
nr:hypothetical protein [Mycobacterium sp.]